MTRSRTSRLLATSLILGAAIFATACSGSESGSGSPTTITEPVSPTTTASEAPSTGGQTTMVDAQDFKFVPSDVTIASGDTIELMNQGSVEHSFAVKDHPEVEVLAQPMETATTVVDLPAGSYTFYCSVPGHEQLGMVGTLTIN